MDRQGMSPAFKQVIRNLGSHSFLQLFGGSEDAFVREISFVDPATQNVTITSVNLSLSQFATCFEQIRYSPVSSYQTEFLTNCRDSGTDGGLAVGGERVREVAGTTL
jgi:hypothetical protein